jgi:hypothetical protein
MREQYLPRKAPGSGSIRTFVVAAALFLLIVLVGWWSGLNYAGYCHKESRFLSDQEMIDIAVAMALERYPFTVAVYDGDGKERKVIDVRAPQDAIRYSSAEEFWKENPSCCALADEVAGKLKMQLIDRLTGSIATFVTVNIKIKYRNKSGEVVVEPLRTYSAISNCGQEWDGI